MESNTNFLGGLDADRNQLTSKPNTYIDASNVDIILDEINGSIVLTNSKGNKLQIAVPTTYIIHSWSTSIISGASQVTINGTSGTYTSTTASTNLDLYDFIQTTFSVLISANQISVYYNETNVIIVENVTGLGVLNPVAIAPNGSISINTNREVPAFSSIQHRPICSTSINDDIYIITTTSTNQDPKVSGDGYGFVWRFNYDSNTFTPANASFNLIYAANLDMSTYWHIPPTAVVARYETDEIQKIWFTDFYNPLRYLNVVDPQVMAEDPSTLSFNPQIDIYKPILTGMIDGGSTPIDAGIYQLCYRLTKNNGSSTVYSEMSDFVSLTNTPMGASYVDYFGLTGLTNKVITWEVSNIDTNYDFIEVVLIQRKTDNNNDLYTIRLVQTTSINNRTSLSFDIDGGLWNDGTDLLIEDIITSSSSWFTHCKTIAEKDNMLIAANLKNEEFDDFSTFDARAYRAFSINGNDIKVTNNGVQETLSIAQVTSSTFSRTKDVINDYSDPTRACYYKPVDPAAPSRGGDLGGAGPNVSYEFYTVAIPVDDDIPMASSWAPYITTNRYTTSFDLNVKSPTTVQTYDTGIDNSGGFYSGYKNSQLSGSLKGYVRGEIYRFGLEPYTKEKKPLFVEWIGDIKFPDHFDPNNNASYLDGTPFPLSDFRLMSIVNGVAYTHVLGIKFTINNLDQYNIGGYSIVRAQREVKDKTIIFQGYTNTADTRDYSGYNTFVTTKGIQVYASNGHQGTVQGNDGFLHCPLINTGDKVLTTSSKMRIKFASTGGSLVQTNGGIDQNKSIKNYYISGSSNNNLHSIDNVVNVLGTEDVSSPGNIDGNAVINRSAREQYRITEDLRYKDYGNKAIYYRLVNNGNIPPLGDYNFYVVNIETVNPNQYGGFSYNARSSNTYISCGHFRPINTKADPIEQPIVFGGDIFVCLYDSMFKQKDWGASLSERYSQVNIVPLESDVNIDLILGAPNYFRANNYTEAFNNNHSSATETNSYFTVYSSENNIKIYTPRPNPFVNVSKWNNRFAASGIKINGENVESWTDFKIADVWDADGDKGGINSIIQSANRMYFWQDRAFGIIQIQPRAFVGDVGNPNTYSQIQLGFGKKLERHDYLSVISGTKHQGSTLSTPSGLYWFDSNNKKLMKFSQEVGSVSDTKGLYAYIIRNFNNNLPDKPCYNGVSGISGITAVHDIKRNKSLFTLHSEAVSFTVCYNELTDSFTSFLSFKPNMYIADGKSIFTFPTTTSEIYVNEEGDYGVYYGVKYKSTIKYIVNDAPNVTKVFDNMALNTSSVNFQTGIQVNQHDDTWARCRIINDYQNTSMFNLVLGTNLKRVERTWKLAIPRNRVLYTTSNSPNIYIDLSPTAKQFGERMRDKYAQVELEYDNNNNNLLKTSNITTIVRESPR